MRVPEFDLPTADGSRLTRADLAGRPWFVYMARHPGCFVCQHALADALKLRGEVQALGGDIVVFFNAKADYVRMWFEKSDLPRDLKVVMDPDAALYEEIGTIRGNLAGQMKDGVAQIWRARSDIRKWRLSSNDMLRMGADLAVAPDGEIVFRHICQDPEDRADPRAVVAALGQPVAA